MNNTIKSTTIPHSDGFETRKRRIHLSRRKRLNTAGPKNLEDLQFNQPHQITQEQSPTLDEIFLFLVWSERRSEFPLPEVVTSKTIFTGGLPKPPSPSTRGGKLKDLNNSIESFVRLSIRGEGFTKGNELLSDLALLWLFSRSYFQSLSESVILQCWLSTDLEHIKYDALNSVICRVFNPQSSVIVSLALFDFLQSKPFWENTNAIRYSCPYFNLSSRQVIKREYKTRGIRRRLARHDNRTCDPGEPPKYAQRSFVGCRAISLRNTLLLSFKRDLLLLRNTIFKVKNPKSTGLRQNSEIRSFILAYFYRIAVRDHSRWQAWQLRKNSLFAGWIRIKYQLNNLIKIYQKKIMLLIVGAQDTRNVCKQKFETSNYRTCLVPFQINQQIDPEKDLTIKSKLRQRVRNRFIFKKRIHLPSLLFQLARQNNLYLAT